MPGTNIIQGANLGLTYNFPDLYDGWGTPMNDNLEEIEYLLFLSVQEMDLSAPPANPVAGQCWVVAGNPTGPWIGEFNSVALWARGQWRFFKPQPGWRCFNLYNSIYYTFYAGAWGQANLTLEDVASTVESLQTEVNNLTTEYGDIAAAAVSAVTAQGAATQAAAVAQALLLLQETVTSARDDAVAAAAASGITLTDAINVTLVAQGDIDTLAQTVLQTAFDISNVRQYFDDLVHQGDTPVVTVIETETVNRIAGDSAIVATLNLIGVANPHGNAFILDTETVYVDDTTTFADKLTEIEVQFGNVNGSITNEADDRIAGDQATATVLSLIGVANLTGGSFILDTNTVYVDDTTTFATELSNIQTQFGTVSGTVTIETNDRISGDQGIESTLSRLGIDNPIGNSFLLDVNTVYVDGFTTMAEKYSQLSSDTTRVQTNLTNYSFTQGSVNSGFAQTFASMGATIDGGSAFQLNISTVYVDDSESLGTRLSNFDTSFGTLGTEITNNANSASTATQAVATELSKVGAYNSDQSAFIFDQDTAFVAPGLSLAEYISNVSSQLGEITILEQSVTSLNQVYGTIGFNINADGVIASETLFAESGPIQQSLAAFDVQSFYIKASGYPQVSPFFYDSTVGKLYLNQLYVGTAQIDDLSVTTLKVANGAITSGASAFSNTTTTTAGTNSTTLQTLGYTAKGGRVSLQCGFFLNPGTAAYTGEGPAPTQLTWASATILEDGNPIYTTAVGVAVLLPSGSYIMPTGQVAFSFTYTPVAKAHTYTLVITASVSDTNITPGIQTSSQSLIIEENMK